MANGPSQNATIETPPPGPKRQTRLRLRLWQRQALDAFTASGRPDFLAVATPGAGKTMFALTAARLALPNLDGRLVVVAPTRHLKLQWASAAERFGLYLDAEWHADAGLPSDFHGVVTTYQQVATSAPQIAQVLGSGMAILDEVHHAGDDLAWGDGITTAFADAGRRLALSGTPFRSDTAAIPFLLYEHGQVVPDVEYGYGEALGDGGVVRPVYFPRFGGHMEWTAPDGSEVEATFDDALPRQLANQRLRAALSLEGEWLPTVLSHAHKQLMKIRVRQPAAGGLVISIDQDHARGVARMLRDRFGVNATVALSEDSNASDKIARFGDSQDPWIVAVRMVSEGVDIPRLRVGVHATTTTTELFFRQAVGRIVRYTGGKGRAYMYVPDDPRLRHFAASIAEARRHRLFLDSTDDDAYDPNDRSQTEVDDVDRSRDEQLSLFMVHSATASDQPMAELDILEDHDEPNFKEPVEDDVVDQSLVIDLAVLPPVGKPQMGRLTGRQERDRLRRLNTQWVRDLATLTGRSHAAINKELNRMASIRKVSEASVGQLDRRVKKAEEWHAREQRKARFGG